MAFPMLTVRMNKAACRYQPKVNIKANKSMRAIAALTGSINEADNLRVPISQEGRLRDCTDCVNVTSKG